jgi:hypothetical protein
VHSRAVCARRAERAGAAPPHRAPLRRLPLRGFPTRRTRSNSCTRRSATRMRCSTRTMALLGRSSLSLTPCSTPSATSTYCEHPKPCPGAILIQGEGGGGGSGAAQAEVGAVGCRGRGGRCRVGGGGSPDRTQRRPHGTTCPRAAPSHTTPANSNAQGRHLEAPAGDAAFIEAAGRFLRECAATQVQLAPAVREWRHAHGPREGGQEGESWRRSRWGVQVVVSCMAAVLRFCLERPRPRRPPPGTALRAPHARRHPHHSTHARTHTQSRSCAGGTRSRQSPPARPAPPSCRCWRRCSGCSRRRSTSRQCMRTCCSCESPARAAGGRVCTPPSVSWLGWGPAARPPPPEHLTPGHAGVPNPQGPKRRRMAAGVRARGPQMPGPRGRPAPNPRPAPPPP